MRTKRQNIQLELALEPEPKGPKPAWRVPDPNARRLGRDRRWRRSSSPAI